MVFHPVWADARVQYPSHFKRFEVKMFAFAEHQETANPQVLSILLFDGSDRCGCVKM